MRGKRVRKPVSDLSPDSLRAIQGGRDLPAEAADLLATAVLRLIQEGWRPAPADSAADPVPRSIALLSPPLRASMSIAGGAQKPPVKEDEHG